METIVDFLRQFGAWGLFIHSFIDAILFPIPAFFLQVSLSLFNPSTALWLATVGFIGCLLGTPIGYGIGKASGSLLLNKVLKKQWIDAATRLFEKNGEAAILIGSFTPIPFKVFTILSGCLRFPLWKLMVFAAIGRAVKFYVVGTLFYLYGRTAEGMVKDVSFYMFVIVVPVLLIGLFIKRKWDRRRARKNAASNEAGLSDAGDGADGAAQAARSEGESERKSEAGADSQEDDGRRERDADDADTGTDAEEVANTEEDGGRGDSAGEAVKGVDKDGGNGDARIGSNVH